MNRKQRRAQGKTGPKAMSLSSSQTGAMAQFFNAAVCHHQNGQLAEAESLCRRILAADSRHADALHLLGMIAHQVGRDDVAVDLIGKAIAANGKSAAYYSNHGLVFKRLGRLEEALASYEAALRIGPNLAEAHCNRGIVLKDLGRLEEALASHEVALKIKPDLAEAHSNRGGVLKELGRLEEALASYEAALRIRPDLAEAHYNRGKVLRDLGRLDLALVAYETAIRIKPNLAEAHCNRGNALSELGRPEDALAAYEAALRIRPDLAEALSNRGNALKDLGRLEEAAASYEAALRIKPNYAEAHYNRGNALKDLGRLDDAIASYDEAIRTRPDYAEAHSSRGNALTELGRLEDALASFEAALGIKPDYAGAHSNRLMTLHCYDEVQESAIFSAVQRFGRRFDQAGASAPFTNAPNPDRRLRIGYVSGDFRRHPVGYFLSGVLAHHARADVEVFCYGTFFRSDDLTATLRASVDHWRSLQGLTDDAASALIRADGIDILVDLSGHTAHNRLTMFALRPAPVQLSWLGYWGSIGLKAIDAVLMDDVMAPEGEERTFTEDVERLAGGRLCYTAPDYAPAVSTPPVLATGTVTFGSFNNPAKITTSALALWANVLAAVPESRLVLKWQTFRWEENRARMLARFVAAGGDGSRLELRSSSPHREMLAEYADIDIALDPFPFSGGTTSYEAMWMGVPVITLSGPRPVSRQTLCLQAALGLEARLAAPSAEAYVRMARDLAAAPDQLAELRSTLRRRMQDSPACDGGRLARELELVFRRRWHQWCIRAEQPEGQPGNPGNVSAPPPRR